MRWWPFGKRDADLDRELQSDLELEEEEQRERGLSAEEARYAARRAFGNPTLIHEQTHAEWGGAICERSLQDIRYALRQFRRAPGFVVIAVLILALGIGANTAMFSLLDQIVLRLLPVKQPERLVKVTVRGNNFGNTYGPDRISWPMFEDLRDRNEVFSDMFCRFPATVTIGYGDRTAQATAELVSGAYFPALGVRATLGRTIVPADDKVPDSAPVVVLSYSFWRNYFHADRTIVGRTIALNSYKMTVIGIAQAGFDGVELGNPAQMFVPIMMKTEMTPRSDGLKDQRRRLAWVAAYGRLKPGIRAQQAQSALQPLLHSILEMEAPLERIEELRGDDDGSEAAGLSPVQ